MAARCVGAHGCRRCGASDRCDHYAIARPCTQRAAGNWPLVTEQEAQYRAKVVMISHALWTTRFGGVLGHSIRLDGTPREIIGVLPEGLAFLIRRCSCTCRNG